MRRVLSYNPNSIFGALSSQKQKQQSREPVFAFSIFLEQRKRLIKLALPAERTPRQGARLQSSSSLPFLGSPGCKARAEAEFRTRKETAKSWGGPRNRGNGRTPTAIYLRERLIRPPPYPILKRTLIPKTPWGQGPNPGSKLVPLTLVPLPGPGPELLGGGGLGGAAQSVSPPPNQTNPTPKPSTTSPMAPTLTLERPVRAPGLWIPAG